jgi:hypothetical protein
MSPCGISAESPVTRGCKSLQRATTLLTKVTWLTILVAARAQDNEMNSTPVLHSFVPSRLVL